MQKLFNFVRPYTKSVLLVSVLIFVRVMADLALPNLMSDIVNNGVRTGDVNMILRTGLIMLGIALIGAASSIASSYFSARNAMGAGRDLRNAVFSKVESFSQAEFDTMSAASLITRTTNDVQQLQMVLLMSQRMIISAPITFIGALLNALNKDAQLIQVILVAIPVIIAIITMINSRAMPLFSLGQKLIDRLNQVLREGLSGVRVIRAFGREEYQSQRFREANNDLTGNSIKVQRIMASMMPLMMFVLNVASVAVIWFGAHNIDAGILQIGDLMAFSQYLAMILFSLLNLSIIFIMLPRAQVSAKRIVEVLETEPRIHDPAHPVALPEPATAQQGLNLVFDRVTFRYPGGEHPAVDNVSFSAAPGETVAIIGSTGSGKSTIAALIQRFFDIESGKITFDGIDIRELTLKELRLQIGYVPQRALLFSGSIAGNLLYGNDAADEEQRREALAIAQAENFVSSLSEGENAFVAQNGSNFSGGQKQRLSIARALVRRPRLYIFDDSFSALDYKTDVALRQALHDKTADATRLIIAQRVSTIMQADRIIVLDEGRVVGLGRHKELLLSCRVYQEIVRSQLAETEIA